MSNLVKRVLIAPSCLVSRFHEGADTSKSGVELPSAFRRFQRKLIREPSPRVIVLLAIMIAFFWASLSFAQSAGIPAGVAEGQASNTAATASPPPTPETESSLEEITVTAERRTERLVDVPIAISSLSAAQLQAGSLDSVTDIAQQVPGLNFGWSGSSLQPTIRGVGSTLAGPGVKANIATYVDGFYAPNMYNSDFDLLNVSRLDVLKGPQGTLFGLSATGGAILLTTLDPVFTPTLTARASYGSYKTSAEDLYGSIGLTDNVAVNLTGYFSRGDGYVTNINTGSDDDAAFRNWNIRTKFLYKATDDLNFVFAYARTSLNDPTQDVFSLYNGLTSASVFAPGVKIATQPGQTSEGFVTANQMLASDESLTAHLNLPFATLASLTQYRDEWRREFLDYDGTAASIYSGSYRPADYTFTQEVNLTSNTGGSFTWVTGVFVYHNVEAFNPFENSVFGGPLTPVFTSENTNESYAIYADGTYRLSDRWFVTGGVRASRDRAADSFNLLGVARRSSQRVPQRTSARGAELSPGQSIQFVRFVLTG